MFKRPGLSIAAKLYSIFALLAMVTAALAAMAAINSPQPTRSGSSARSGSPRSCSPASAPSSSGAPSRGRWRESRRVTATVAAGEPVAVPYSGRRDEIGALARSIGVFQEAMRSNAALGLTVRSRRRCARPPRVRGDCRDRALRRRRGGDAGRARRHLRADAQVGRRNLSAAAEEAAERTAGAASASAEASGNVRDIARRPRSSPPRCWRSTVRSRSRTPSPRRRWPRPTAPIRRSRRSTTRRGASATWSAHHRDRRADQPAGAQRHHRGGTRGRSRPRLCGRRQRGQGARRADRQGDRGDSAQIAGMQQATVRSVEAIGAIQRTIRDDRRYHRRDRGGGDRAGRRHAGDRAQRRDRVAAHRRDRGEVATRRRGDGRDTLTCRCRKVGGRRSRYGGGPHPRPDRRLLRETAYRVTRTIPKELPAFRTYLAQTCLPGGVERRLDVPRQAARRHQHRIEADVALRVVRMARRARLPPPR